MHRFLSQEISWVVMAFTITGKTGERTDLKRKVVKSGFDISNQVAYVISKGIYFRKLWDTNI